MLPMKESFNLFKYLNGWCNCYKRNIILFYSLFIELLKIHELTDHPIKRIEVKIA